jgi:hypothetical protein
MTRSALMHMACAWLRIRQADLHGASASLRRLTLMLSCLSCSSRGLRAAHGRSVCRGDGHPRVGKCSRRLRLSGPEVNARDLSRSALLLPSVLPWGVT